MFIKPSKKWRNSEGNDAIMVPYTYYRLCESYREAVKATVCGPIGEHCPATLLRRHPAATLYVDADSGKYIE